MYMETNNYQKEIDAFKGKALNLNVFVKEVQNTNETESGLDLSKMVDKNEKYKKSVVVSIGERCPDNGIKVGDVVLFDKSRSSDLTIEGIQYNVVSYEDLVMVV